MLRECFKDRYDEIKSIDDLVYKALEIVTELFKDDLDKGGHPYISHLTRVYMSVHTKDQKVIALLHDIIEDKGVTKDELLDIGFPEKIVDNVVILSRPNELNYTEYIDNLVKSGSIDALTVKLADLNNNMDLSRINSPTSEDHERINKKYAPSYEKVFNRLKEMER